MTSFSGVVPQPSVATGDPIDAAGGLHGRACASQRFQDRLALGPGWQGRQAPTGRLVPGPGIRSHSRMMLPVNQ